MAHVSQYPVFVLGSDHQEVQRGIVGCHPGLSWARLLSLLSNMLPKGANSKPTLYFVIKRGGEALRTGRASMERLPLAEATNFGGLAAMHSKDDFAYLLVDPSGAPPPATPAPAAAPKRVQPPLQPLRENFMDALMHSLQPAKPAWGGQVVPAASRCSSSSSVASSMTGGGGGSVSSASSSSSERSSQEEVQTPFWRHSPHDMKVAAVRGPSPFGAVGQRCE